MIDECDRIYKSRVTVNPADWQHYTCDPAKLSSHSSIIFQQCSLFVISDENLFFEIPNIVQDLRKISTVLNHTDVVQIVFEDGV